MSNNELKVFAYFLPQFYSTPENDKHWGKGFTEWTNVKKAKPLFDGHECPKIPSNNDFYDLSDHETLKTVIKKTEDIGIDALAYWYYWFGNGKQALTKVPEIHRSDASIEQNYFFAWANNNWSKEWIGDRKTIIYPQEYNINEIDLHIDSLSYFFEDERYVKWNDQPVLQLNEAHKEEGYEYIFELDNRFRQRSGTKIKWIFPSVFVNDKLKGLSHFIVGYPTQDILKIDTQTKIRRNLSKWGLTNKPVVISKEHFLKMFRKEIKRNEKATNYIPCILSGWDNTYRYTYNGFLIDGHIGELVEGQAEIISKNLSLDNLPFIFIKAYNEWAEGNILENYVVNGRKYDISKLINEVVKTKLKANG